MAQKLKKKIKVRVKLDDTVYVIDRQSLIKTYISRIVLKQWFTKEGIKKQKTTYCIPDDEVGEQAEKTKFVLDDFGKIIFSSYSSASKKFKSRSKYLKDNTTGEEAVEYTEPDETPIPSPAPDPEPSISGYITVPSTGSNKADTSKTPVEENGPSYYDSTGKKVYPELGFIDAKGNIIKVRYYDGVGNAIYHRGNYLGKGDYVYEDGRVVPAGVKILRYMELYGNASIKDGVQIKPEVDEDTPTNMDVDDTSTIIINN